MTTAPPTLTRTETLCAEFVARHHRHLSVTQSTIPDWYHRLTGLISAYHLFPGTTPEKQKENALIKAQAFHESYLPMQPGKRDYWIQTVAALLLATLNDPQS